MSTGETGPTNPSDPRAGGPQPTEEELRAAYEAEIKKISVEQVVLEQVVTLINLGMRRTGLAPGTEDERDLDQVRLAIEAIRGQLPLFEQSAPQQLGPIRDALSQLQLAYVRLGGSPSEAPAAPGVPGGPDAGAPAPSDAASAGDQPGRAPGGPSPAEPSPGSRPGEGPAQRSGRLWIPGQ
jgi:hypothetical protein